MRLSRRRVAAIFRKELREYRHNTPIIATMLVVPLVFVLNPLIQVLVLPASSAPTLRHEHILLYLLAIPALVPATLSSYSVVGERQQGTLEPVLASPLRKQEFILGKAMAAFVPSVAVAYLVYILFVIIVELFAVGPVASAMLRLSDVLAQLIYTPLLAGFSIWIGMSVSTRVSDARSAQQLGALSSLPSVAVTSLIAYNVIHTSLPLALVFGILLLGLNRLGWRLASAIFDRERLILGTKS